jgi:DNA-directed RNA polymerase sigma subunit (sigma70/sigma32)
LLAAEEEHVLRLRFGIGLAEPQSFEEIGKSLGMDPKRVSRLESRALAVLTGGLGPPQLRLRRTAPPV